MQWNIVYPAMLCYRDETLPGWEMHLKLFLVNEVVYLKRGLAMHKPKIRFLCERRVKRGDPVNEQVH